jgi:hypothetical protein
MILLAMLLFGGAQALGRGQSILKKSEQPQA